MHEGNIRAPNSLHPSPFISKQPAALINFNSIFPCWGGRGEEGRSWQFGPGFEPSLPPPSEHSKSPGMQLQLCPAQFYPTASRNGVPLLTSSLSLIPPSHPPYLNLPTHLKPPWPPVPLSDQFLGTFPNNELSTTNVWVGEGREFKCPSREGCFINYETTIHWNVVDVMK